MGIDVAGTLVFLPALAALGVGIGFVAGMFGIGGGFMLTPLLHIVFRIPLPVAVGSVICQQIGTSIGAFLKHREYGHGEPRVDLVMLGASLMGADAGARMLDLLTAAGRLPSGAPVVSVALEIVYALLLSVTAALTLRTAWKAWAHGGMAPPHHAPLSRVRIPPYLALPGVGIAAASVPVLAYTGFLTGALSGMLGIGGGVALLPVLIYGYGFSIKDAAGTGILLLLATVLIGTVEHAARGNVDLRVSMAILVGSSIGAQLGARSTARLSNQTLRISFAALLAATVVTIAADLIGLI